MIGKSRCCLLTQRIPHPLYADDPVLPSDFKTSFQHISLSSPDQDRGLTADVNYQQGMVTPPRQLIPRLVIPGLSL